MQPIVLRAAIAGDLREVKALLTAEGLPLGLARDFPGGYVVAHNGTMLVGCAGVERYRQAGLLRSVAVAVAARGQGLGRRLITNRVAWAAHRRLSPLYLLTLTAADYFARVGFFQIRRDAVAESVQASEEFATVCPRSATCMALLP